MYKGAVTLSHFSEDKILWKDTETAKIVGRGKNVSS